MGTTVERRDDIKEAHLSIDHQDNSGMGTAFVVGHEGVTKICQGAENGEYCEIPYIQIWCGEKKIFEAVKHRWARIHY